MPNFIDLSGKRFGRWTVIDRAPDHFTKSGIRITMWNCVCDCGKRKMVTANSLRKGTSTSCGCYATEQKSKLLSDRNKKTAIYNGASKESLFPVWKAMIHRCYSKADECYSLYGGRGIAVCDEWRENYEEFKEWALSHGWKKGLSIDRIDNNGPYSPENCRWATAKEQANNRRSNHLISGFGETKNIGQWAETFNMPYTKLYHKLSKCSWSIERVVMGA